MRDPRIDPRAGDVLLKDDVRATVLDTNTPPDGLIAVECSEGARTWFRLVTLTRWQLGTTGARVLVGDVPVVGDDR